MQKMMMILLLLSIICVTILFLKKQSTGKKISTPRSPPTFPVIGNLHQLGRYPHRSLCSLSHRYGPRMLLHFGRVPVLEVSSADAAQDVLKTHDHVFASRPRSKIFRKLHYDGRDVGLAPYGEYWRQMKSVCVLHLLSNKMVRSFRDVRKEEIRIVMENIRKSNSSRINLSKLLASLTNDVICRVAFGKKYGGDTDFMELIERFEKLLGSFSIGTYVPWLAWLDWISGLDAEVEKTKNDFDEFLERVVKDHVDGGGDKNDFVHVLLAIQREKSIGFEIDRISIKAIIMVIKSYSDAIKF
ncbi:cytochrome P450 71A24-like [Brassica napus]|uniref:cytochrome P450 71A24-like n=1 Tax=Brassica napus TaxID=3708 RepID=UPI0006AA6052|nr:cytochrome P450 71A24-like [Brassica napus]